jgi:hypothetical protein
MEKRLTSTLKTEGNQTSKPSKTDRNSKQALKYEKEKEENPIQSNNLLNINPKGNTP